MKRSLLWLALILAALPACAQQEQLLLFPAQNSPIHVSGGPGSLVVGDLNGDKKPDLVVASWQPRTLTVLVGQGDGRFRKAKASPIQLSDSPGNMVLRDFNNDGDLDLAIASHNSYSVTLLLGDGESGFTFASSSPIQMKEGEHPHTHGLEAGDLNGDGQLDLVTVNSNPDNDVAVVFGDGTGGFLPAPGSPFKVGPSPYPGALGDLNEDGHTDIVATSTDRSQDNRPASRALTLLLGDGKGGFRMRLAPIRTLHPWFVTIHDVNGDKTPDLIATHAESSELTVLVGDGKGGFIETTGSPFDLGHSAWHLAMADVNQDGHADVLAAAGDSLRLMLGNGGGLFQPAPQPHFPTGKGCWQLALGDFNSDGKPDVATTNLEEDSVTILLAQ